MKTWILLPDVHVPYEDKRAVNLVIQVAAGIQPHGLAQVGDFGDFYCVSAHEKDPRRVNDLEWEIGEQNKLLDRLDALGCKEKKFVAGNHEYRLERHLMKHSPALFGMLKVEKLLRLKERGWQYTRYMDSARVGRLHLTHEVGNAGAVAHSKARAVFESNVAIGHTHRLAVSYHGNAQGKARVGAMLGWLGDVKQIDYAHKVQALRDWQLGFGVAYVEPNGTAHVQPIPIIDYKCVVNGRLFKG